ncbi:MAG: hypothetical protein JWP44_2845 [Mucilaginibacter sp.]|nr:hypothetical protein [Mucilaginibacter sp.]
MIEPTYYPYSLKFSIGAIVLMLVFLLMLLSNVIAAHNMAAWVIFGILGLAFGFMMVLLVTTRLIPAIKGDIALSLDQQGLSDYIRDVSIGWKDIKEISLVRGRSASSLRIDLKWESDYGSRIAIPLRWIKGKDQEIYETVLCYFEEESVDKTE